MTDHATGLHENAALIGLCVTQTWNIVAPARFNEWRQ